MAKEGLQWYMDLRRFGGCKHAGFGLGFDRFLMYLTGMQNIRDVEPFPRTPRNLNSKAYSLGFFVYNMWEVTHMNEYDLMNLYFNFILKTVISHLGMCMQVMNNL